MRLLQSRTIFISLLCGFLLACISTVAGADAPVARAADAPAIDLYTMDVGDTFTEKFGHAAICTRYTNSPKKDRCYNYGTTNFKDPAGLAWNFVRGRSRFWVSVTTVEKMMDLYSRRDRTVWVQSLPLSDEQATTIAAKLLFDSQEENKYYNYHHFKDNCATRIRDLLNEHTGDKLRQDNQQSTKLTYRELTRRGFASSSVLLIISDYVLGRIGDTSPTKYEAMFLPRFFREAVQETYGVEPFTVYERGGEKITQVPGMQRLFAMFLILLLVSPLWFAHRKGKRSRIWGILPVSLLFIIGTLLWTYAILSPLPMARYNECLLLFFPLDIILLLKTNKKRTYAILRLTVVLLATILTGIGLLRQPLWATAILPVLTLLPFVLPKRPSSSTRLR